MVWQRWLHILTAVAGILITCGSVSFVQHSESIHVADEFEKHAATKAIAIENQLNDYLHMLTAISAFFDASENVTMEEFSTFTAPLHDRLDAIQALEWIPRVNEPDRVEFAEQAAREWGRPFQITEWMNGSLERAERREVYFPVYYVTPTSGNEPAIGFDVASNETRAAALEQSMASGGIVATASIQLVQERGKQKGVLAFAPKYDSHVGERPDPAHIRGFVLGVFRLGDILTAATGDLAKDLKTELYDTTGDEQEVLAEVGQISARELTKSTSVSFGGRQWVIHTSAGAEFRTARTTLWPVATAIGGGLITLLVSALARTWMQRTIRVERLVHERTSQLRNSEAVLHETNAKLEQRNDEIVQLVYAITHDLQTPLATLTGAVQSMMASECGGCLSNRRTDPDSSDDSFDWPALIERSSSRMTGMLEDLMLYAKADSDLFEVRSVDVAELVREVVVELRERPAALGICIQSQSVPCRTIGDPKLLRRSLENLVGNAVKFMPEDADGRIMISVSDESENLRITVEDNGPGVDPRRLETLFQPFKRGTQVKTGTGLGLSIVRRTAEVMGGRAWLESDGVSGTKAVIELPNAVAPEGSLMETDS